MNPESVSLLPRYVPESDADTYWQLESYGQLESPTRGRFVWEYSLVPRLLKQSSIDLAMFCFQISPPEFRGRPAGGSTSPCR
jgi:hypothetical protein